jgi:hypothetical protein
LRENGISGEKPAVFYRQPTGSCVLKVNFCHSPWQKFRGDTTSGKVAGNSILFTPLLNLGINLQYPGNALAHKIPITWKNIFHLIATVNQLA